MSFLSKYKTDKTAEEQGVWVVLADEIEVKVARLNNKSARDLRRQLEKPYRNMSSIPDAANEEILIKVIARAVLKDWKGVTDEKGQAQSYSADLAEKLFREFPDFLNDVVSAAMTRETFQTEAVESAKND